MPFSERTGDMFAANDIDALAHGVNVKGVMGGVAGMFANKYPEMHDYYKETCKDGRFKAGQILPWKEEGKPAVYNLATQENPGADAKYDLVHKTVKRMLNHAETYGINNIGIPEIGCGIGGLGLRRVRKIVKNLADKSPVNVVMFHYEPPKRTMMPKNNLNQKNWFDDDSFDVY